MNRINIHIVIAKCLHLCKSHLLTNLLYQPFIADPHGQAEALREEMKAVCWARGRQVEAHFTDGTTLIGEAIGLNEDASLILRTEDGTDHTVRTADVGVL